MDEKNKQEQQGEAALSIFMDLHAQRSGQQLWDEFEAAQQENTVPVLSQKQDRKFKSVMSGASHSPWGKLGAIAAKVAIWAVAIFAFATVTIVAADASGLVSIQTPLWEGYFVSNHSQAITVHFGKTEPTRTQDKDAIRTALESHLPDGFTHVVDYATYNGKSLPGFYIAYADEEDGQIILDSRSPGSGLVRFPKNGGEAKEIKYLTQDMVLLICPQGWQLIWLDEEEGLYYALTGNNIREDDFWDLVNAVLQR